MEWVNELDNWIAMPGTLGLVVSIILLSYLLEDLAIITAALLAADNALPVEYALGAIFIGIASGDAALYGLGLLASRWRALRFRLLSNKKMRYVRKKLVTKPFLNIAIIRFIPGLRTLGFTLSGLFRINFYSFLASVVAATAAWTMIVFFCIYQLGSVEWLQDSYWKWIVAPVALLLLWLLNRISSPKRDHNKRQGVSA
ncbi:DedA family protein [Vibrio sp. HN007]|uniref:DedA family protein n=1 Tax=Vibrio iocasae TaxID=3098914 RepID=UPI0035D4BA8E